MRVLHALNELRSSGAEIRLFHALPHFDKEGIEPIMLSTGENEGEFANQYRSAGITVYHLPFRRKASYTRDFYKLIKRNRIDLVHLHAERANFVLGMTSRGAGAKVVRTVCNVFAYEGKLRVIRRIERVILRLLGIRHISIGPSVEKNEINRMANPTTRVDNWIGPQFRPPTFEERSSARASFKVPENAIVIATVGNCSEVKNHQAVLEALGLLAGRFSQPLIYLHAGHGQMEAQERDLAKNLREAAEIRFLGTVRDVQQLLWASDIYCMPSLYEGVGNAALEALACGVPAVLADVPGLRDISAPAAGVRFVEPTAAGVAEGTLNILKDPEAARASVAQVAEKVRAERSAEKAVGTMVQIYQSV